MRTVLLLALVSFCCFLVGSASTLSDAKYSNDYNYTTCRFQSQTSVCETSRFVCCDTSKYAANATHVTLCCPKINDTFPYWILGIVIPICVLCCCVWPLWAFYRRKRRRKMSATQGANIIMPSTTTAPQAYSTPMEGYYASQQPAFAAGPTVTATYTYAPPTAGERPAGLHY